jgi:hypothetical protein
VGERPARTVAEDVQARLTSVLSRWNSTRVRATLLLPGREEATFYEPTEASLDVRSLVVVAIRNSRLEDLASTRDVARKYGAVGPVIPDQEIPSITAEAVRYFASVDLRCSAKLLSGTVLIGDPFCGLAAAYPAAWRAVSELAKLGDEDRSFDVVEARLPELPLGPPISAGWRTTARGSHVVSGMDSSIEPALQRVLRLVRNGIVPALYADSFKMITRHPRKLFAVLEYVLGHGRPVVTQNYYLRNGYVACRRPLVRPAHTLEEARAKLRDEAGVAVEHARALREMLGYC